MSMIDLSAKEQQLAERFNPDSANTLALSKDAGGVAFMNAGEALSFAKMMALANSGVRKHLRGNPGACLAVVVQAVEWGMSPFAVANKSYFVNDQIAFESQLVQAVILRRAPIKGRIHFEFTGQGQNRICRAWARLRDEDEIVEYISPLFKDIQPKNSPLWKNDPDQQHCYMAGRALCRRHFPDVLLGVYAEDEIGGAIDPGPIGARDVSPPRGMVSKLDALAMRPAATQQSAPVAETDHDPSTGEVFDAGTDGGVAEDDLGDGTGSSDPAAQNDNTDEDGDPEHDALIDRLRAKAMRGTQPLKRALAGLAAPDHERLTDQDRKGLEDAAALADRGAGAA